MCTHAHSFLEKRSFSKFPRAQNLHWRNHIQEKRILALWSTRKEHRAYHFYFWSSWTQAVSPLSSYKTLRHLRETTGEKNNPFSNLNLILLKPCLTRATRNPARAKWYDVYSAQILVCCSWATKSRGMFQLPPAAEWVNKGQSRKEDQCLRTMPLCSSGSNKGTAPKKQASDMHRSCAK